MDSKGQKFEFPASSESDAMLTSEAALPRLKQLEERQVIVLKEQLRTTI